MPKTKKRSIIEGVVHDVPFWDVPIWNTLTAEMGDPRPYTAAEIGHVVADPEPCVDVVGFDTAHQWVTGHAMMADIVFDVVAADLTATMDEVYPWPNGKPDEVIALEKTQFIPRVIV